MKSSSSATLLIAGFVLGLASGEATAGKSRAVSHLPKLPSLSPRVTKTAPAPVPTPVPALTPPVKATPAPAPLPTPKRGLATGTTLLPKKSLGIPAVTPRAKASSGLFNQDWNALRKKSASSAIQPPAPKRPTGAFNDATSEVVQRAMSRAELEATQKTGLLRGGWSGTHHLSDAVNGDANRARQRLALETTPELRVEMRVPKGTPSSPTRIEEKYGMPGGGTQRTATGPVPVIIKKTKDLTKK